MNSAYIWKPMFIFFFWVPNTQTPEQKTDECNNTQKEKTLQKIFVHVTNRTLNEAENKTYGKKDMGLFEVVDLEDPSQE